MYPRAASSISPRFHMRGRCRKFGIGDGREPQHYVVWSRQAREPSKLPKVDFFGGLEIIILSFEYYFEE